MCMTHGPREISASVFRVFKTLGQQSKGKVQCPVSYSIFLWARTERWIHSSVGLGLRADGFEGSWVRKSSPGDYHMNSALPVLPLRLWG